MKFVMNKTRLIITSGDPAGCGPYITLKAIEEYSGRGNDFYVVGDASIFERLPAYKKVKKRFNLIDANISGIDKLEPGSVSPLSGCASLQYLKIALKVLKDKKIKGLVTAPVSKEAVQLNLRSFKGHTEYLADSFGVETYAMMMTSPVLKVILLTRHIDLKDVSSSISVGPIADVFSLLYKALQQQFKIKCPKIVIAAVNPHAGIKTFLGQEEEVLIAAKRKIEKPFIGPLPADTIFIKDNLSKYDCVVCAYHDQAMIPFKLLSLRQGVNLTLGLPIVRTSPAHGVAADLIRAGGRPFHSSMLEAVKLAIKLSS